MRTESTLIERIVEVFFDAIPEDQFSIAEEKYSSDLKINTPDYFKQEEKQLCFEIRDNNSSPEIFNQRLQVTNNYWECNTTNNDPVWRVRFEHNRFVLNFRKHLISDPGTKEEFSAFVLTHLKKLKQFFGIKIWLNFRLTYFFRIDSTHLDDVSLARPDWIEVKELLQPFVSMPTPEGFKQYTHPCKINLHWEQLHDEKVFHSGLMVESNLKQQNYPLDIRLFSDSTEMCKAKPDDNVIFDNLIKVIHVNYENVMSYKMRENYRGDLL